MNQGRRSIWREPRPAGAPAPGRADWLLVGAFELTAVLETIFRPEVKLRLLVAVIAIALAPVLLWRRSHPLTAALIGWGAASALSLITLLTDLGDVGLYSMMLIMLLLYSLVRWGSGREVVVGLGFVAASVALGMSASVTTWPDVFGGVAFLSLFVAAAAAFRYRADLWGRQKVEIRNQERVGLARELHDTVAHHVSAIAVQAQAGRVIAATSPAKAAEVLAAIENEASKTLAEMRSMVRVLRDDESAEYSPQPGISDLAELSRSGPPQVEVRLSGALTEVPRAVDTAVYRLAQESLTNAVRHARGAHLITIDVMREDGSVKLSVADDGRAQPSDPTSPGFGLLGMKERAELLGGSLKAGPGASGGWVVEASLPVDGRR